MGNRKLKERNEIPEKYKWHIDDMYDSRSSWDEDVDKVTGMAEDFLGYRGHIADSPESMLNAFKASDDMDVVLERLVCYAKMKLDEDTREADQQAMYDKVASVIANVSARLSFIMPELSEIPDETFKEYIEKEPGLKVYEHMIDEIIRARQHVLSEKEENLLAQLSEVTGAASDVYDMLCDADMSFGTILDEDGSETELTHGNYIEFMRSHDRSVREAAFNAMYEQYKGHINTITANFNANVKEAVIGARIRSYPSSREASLYGNKIPLSVYDNLIEQVHSALPVMHEYIELRKRVLGVDELKMHDIYVPLVKVPERDIPFEEAVDMMLTGLAPLGEKYLSDVKKGTESGWIDVYENKGKASGAYSYGSYDSDPYILLNYNNNLEDVFTLVHEMGHSMNSLYTHTEQPFCYGGHSIFTAEVASTVNEALFMQHLLKTTEDPDMKKYVLNMYIEAFRTTLFRQTMFAEFERNVHAYVEAGESLTSKWLCEEYDRLNSEYFGPALSHDDMIQYEWARIPHFYRSFYVYQYATGYSAATAISKLILEGGEKEVSSYLKFLGSGTSDYPVELLKIAGVDMESPEPVAMAMETFKKLVEEFKEVM